MAEGSRNRDPVYSLHFSQAAAEASYLLRVTSEPLVAIRALATIEGEAKKVLAEMVEEARKSDQRGFRSQRPWVSPVRRRRPDSTRRRVQTVKVRRVARLDRLQRPRETMQGSCVDIPPNQAEARVSACPATDTRHTAVITGKDPALTSVDLGKSAARSIRSGGDGGRIACPSLRPLTTKAGQGARMRCRDWKEKS